MFVRIHLQLHKVIKLIKHIKINEMLVKISNRDTITRLSCSPAVVRYILFICTKLETSGLK